jgi:hypothetical protein
MTSIEISANEEGPQLAATGLLRWRLSNLDGRRWGVVLDLRTFLCHRPARPKFDVFPLPADIGDHLVKILG